MNKNANALTPGEVLALSMIGGGGTFGAIKLLQDAMTQAHGGPKPQGWKKTMNVNMPSPPPAPAALSPQGGYPQEEQLEQQYPKMANEQLLQEAAQQGAAAVPGFTMQKGLAGVAGTGMGFMGMKMLYDEMKSNQMNRELEQKKQLYMQTLQQAKFASDTPFTDGFCDAIAEAINKKAADADYSFADALKNVGNKATFGVGERVPQTMGWLAGGTGAAVLAAMIMADKNRQAREQNRDYPARVVLQQPPQI